MARKKKVKCERVLLPAPGSPCSDLGLRLMEAVLFAGAIHDLCASVQAARLHPPAPPACTNSFLPALMVRCLRAPSCGTEIARRARSRWRSCEPIPCGLRSLQRRCQAPPQVLAISARHRAPVRECRGDGTVLPGAFQPHHDHASDPEKDNVEPCDRHRGWVILFQILCIVRPA